MFESGYTLKDGMFLYCRSSERSILICLAASEVLDMRNFDCRTRWQL